jgi:ATP-dependent DNA helicase RecQ
VAHARFDLLIKTLMRLYGGELYTDFTTISETQIAQVMKLTPAEVQIELEQLHKLQLMVYEPKNESPKVTFLLPRQDAERLPIDKTEFDRRRDLHFAKMESMIIYVEQDHRCRMQLIQEYFDEITEEVCGMCDVCIGKKKKDNLEALHDYEDQVLYLLKQKPVTVEELESQVDPKDKELFIEVVRELVDAGEIYYDELWTLHLAEKK